MGVLSSFQSVCYRGLDLVEPYIPQSVTPNRLSWARIWGIPLLWFGYALEPLIGVGVYGLFCLTDLLDGYLARKRSLDTPYGKVLDERTDKGFTLGTIALLFADQILPLDYSAWEFQMMLVIVLREAVITTMREIWPDIAKRVPSLTAAKAKTFLMMFGFGFMLVSNLEGSFWQNLSSLGLAAVAVAAGLSLFSGLQYVYEFIRRS